MGSKGIRRRKPKRPLPRLKGRKIVDGSDVPPIMWPAAGSGFEADPFSPAGTSQRIWWLINRPRNDAGQRRWNRLVWRWVGVVAAVVMVLWMVIAVVRALAG